MTDITLEYTARLWSNGTYSWAALHTTGGWTAMNPSGTAIMEVFVNSADHFFYGARMYWTVDRNDWSGTVVSAYFTGTKTGFTDNYGYGYSVCKAYPVVLANPAAVASSDWNSHSKTSVATLSVDGDTCTWTLNSTAIDALNDTEKQYVTFAIGVDRDMENGASPAELSWYYYPGWLITLAAKLVITVTTISVQTDAATSIASGNATLNGTLIEDDSDTPVTCSFVYGKTSACELGAVGGETVVQGATYDYVLTGLDTNTTYYFKAKAVGNSTATVYGSVLSFSTANYPSRPLTRVCGIHSRFRAGVSGQSVHEYRMELLLGGLETDWIPPYSRWEPSLAGDKQEIDYTKTSVNPFLKYSQYIVQTSDAVKRQDFDKVLGITYKEYQEKFFPNYQAPKPKYLP